MNKLETGSEWKIPKEIKILDKISNIRIYNTIEPGKHVLINIPVGIINIINDVYEREKDDIITNQLSLVDYISSVFGGLKLKSIHDKITPSEILKLNNK